MWAAILGVLQGFPALLDLINRAVTAYEAHVKAIAAQNLQAGLQPLEQGTPASDADQAAAAKAVADNIAGL